MLVIRLARTGRKKQPYYRITVADKRRAATGKFVAQIGHFNPYTKEFKVNQEELDKYLKSGAQPSSSVVKLLKSNKIKLPSWAEANLVVRKRAPKQKDKETEEGATPPTEAKSKEPEGEKTPPTDTENQPQNTKSSEEDKKPKEDTNK